MRFAALEFSLGVCGKSPSLRRCFVFFSHGVSYQFCYCEYPLPAVLSNRRREIKCLLQQKRNSRAKCAYGFCTIWRPNARAALGRSTSRLFLAENDACLRQIVRRELHFNFIARDNANEMLA